MNPRISFLFIPGNNPSMVQNASFFKANAVIFDLEDAVNVKEKDSARILVREALKTFPFPRLEIVVRVNGWDTPFAIADIQEVCGAQTVTLMIPKATKTDLQEIDAFLTTLEKEQGKAQNTFGLLPIIETAYALETIDAIVHATPRVNGLLLGAEDLTADFGIQRTKSSEEIQYARQRVSTICKAYKISGIDTPFTDVEDMEGLRQDTLHAKSMGFTGKACINPRQIQTVLSAFAPTKEEVAYAKEVLEARDEAFRNHLGVFSLYGKMIDAPIIQRATQTLALHQSLQ